MRKCPYCAEEIQEESVARHLCNRKINQKEWTVSGLSSVRNVLGLSGNKTVSGASVFIGVCVLLATAACSRTDKQIRFVGLGNGVLMEFVPIPAGSFMMGSTKSERDWAAQSSGGKADASWVKNETEPRRVSIARGFWLGKTEVTVGQWRRFVEEVRHKTDAEKRGEAWCFSNGIKPWSWVKGKSWRDPNWPGVSLRDDHPVACISWNDAKAFCEWLNRTQKDKLPDGYEFRLPGEAEWEYAARGGLEGTKFSWGDRPEDIQGRLNGASDDIIEIGVGSGTWYNHYEWSDGYSVASPVDVFGAMGRNGFELADMLGNVWEWCEDWYDDDGPHATINRTTSSYKVLRGGAFNDPSGCLRCAKRAGNAPSMPFANIGFRVCIGNVESRNGVDGVVAENQSGGGGFHDDGDQEMFNRRMLSAEQGDPIAQYNIGCSYEKGNEVLQDHAEAVKWFRLAAEQGLANAQYSLGSCYFNAKGVPQDAVEAVKWFRLAAEQGDVNAQGALASCYLFGVAGVPLNQNEGIKLARLAAEQGCASVQLLLGTCYYSGIGVQQNFVEALAWVETSGLEQGLAMKASLLKTMTTSQVEEGARLSREYAGKFNHVVKK